MKEFTIGTVVLGLVMSIILGAANAYLGLKAGQTIAATYPAAVISMAVLKLFRGSILQENLARTAGSIGESVAAGAVFTIPAFVMVGAWPSFSPADAYWKSTVLMITGSVLGVLFVSLVRRAMVEDKSLPFPESVAAAEIHKAGRRGSGAAKYLFYNMIFGGAVFMAGKLKLFAASADFFAEMGSYGKSLVKLGAAKGANAVGVGGVTKFSVPDISPAYVGVGYIIGPGVASLNFAGAVLAWGLLVPLLIYFLGPQLHEFLPKDKVGIPESWDGTATAVWKFIVRPIAVGGMLVGAGFTMFRMREKIGAGLKRAVGELSAKAPAPETVTRTERYMASKTIFALIGIVFIGMAALYMSFAGSVAGITAAIVMLIAGFFFCTVSGYLVGMIGSSNNPISGLTISTLIVAALLMVALGVSGSSGVIAVLGVAAVVCVAAAVAGELLQDFKVGYILGGTPRTIQIVELVSVVVSAAVMYFPLMLLYQNNIKQGGTGFGDKDLSAPQAGLMAFLAQGIVGGDMPWPLVVVGICMGFAMILLQVKSPMLVSVGMYLPFGTTSAIFVGGMIRGLSDMIATRRSEKRAREMLRVDLAGITDEKERVNETDRQIKKSVESQLTRITNIGILVASGFIAGEALMGLVEAGFGVADRPMPALLQNPSYFVGVGVLVVLAIVLIVVPMRNAGDPNEPAPPSAMM
ncbi:MAG: oligopeptide transporter, OPT family [Planctomycetes bacterium]|nr:oligopeptide transporter, OPT family [Planctomycetota bacterium]